MHTQKWLLAIGVITACLILTPSLMSAQTTEEPVVRAVLFFSPTCPHCHAVINDVLIPMVDQYGSRLQIMGIDISQAGGQQLYQTAIEHYQIPPERRGVPTLVLEELVLVGSLEIPQQFPSLVEEKLATGGTVWPDLPGLAAALPDATPEEATPTPPPPPTSTPTSVIPTDPAPPSPTARFTELPTLAPTATPTHTPVPSALTLGSDALPPAQTPEPPSDPVGMTLAGVVLVNLIASLVYAIWRLFAARLRLFRLDGHPLNTIQTWLIPLLALAGLGVSIYLAFVEINQVEAICGPVGECNIVQASPYARILGVPIAVLGILNYLLVVTLWLGRRYLPGVWATLPALGLLGLSLVGVLFSIYLTWLEIFVIRAVCLWCLSSAIITLVLLFQVMPGLAAAKLQRNLLPQ
ncbi:MAG: hypothetical protein KJ077_48990 [Anaerolineae bacterium]|nr:hypothetical protein [Anaerolineae bacterium]